MQFVKFCGFQRPDDIDQAVSLGVSAIGLNFVPSSKRFLQLEDALSLRAHVPAGILAVGIFADADAHHVRRYIEQLKLDAIQLHGAEPPEFSSAFNDVVTIKALRTGSHAAMKEHAPFSKYLLLDAQSGGSGETFDHASLAGIDPALLTSRVIIAGGLDSQNVASLRRYSPFGVDTASGIESEPGKKSFTLMQQFLAQARS